MGRISHDCGRIPPLLVDFGTEPILTSWTRSLFELRVPAKQVHSNKTVMKIVTHEFRENLSGSKLRVQASDSQRYLWQHDRCSLVCATYLCYFLLTLSSALFHESGKIICEACPQL